MLVREETIYTVFLTDVFCRFFQISLHKLLPITGDCDILFRCKYSFIFIIKLNERKCLPQN